MDKSPVVIALAFRPVSPAPSPAIETTVSAPDALSVVKLDTNLVPLAFCVMIALAEPRVGSLSSPRAIADSSKRSPSDVPTEPVAG